MLLLGASVAKDNKKNPSSKPVELTGPEETSPGEVTGQDARSSTELTNDAQKVDEKFDEHLLVSLDCKLRLDQIAQRLNADRKRKRLGTRPLGWFVGRGLEDWMTQMEAELGLSRPKRP